MNEEEREAVEKMQYIIDLINKNGQYIADVKDIKHIVVITNLIIKYQKEIEHIRDKAECMDYYSLNDVIDDLSKLIGD